MWLDPEDLQAVEFIKKGVGLKILPRLTPPFTGQVFLYHRRNLKNWPNFSNSVLR